MTSSQVYEPPPRQKVAVSGHTSGANDSMSISGNVGMSLCCCCCFEFNPFLSIVNIVKEFDQSSGKRERNGMEGNGGKKRGMKPFLGKEGF